MDCPFDKLAAVIVAQKVYFKNWSFLRMPKSTQQFLKGQKRETTPKSTPLLMKSKIAQDAACPRWTLPAAAWMTLRDVPLNYAAYSSILLETTSPFSDPSKIGRAKCPHQQPAPHLWPRSSLATRLWPSHLPMPNFFRALGNFGHCSLLNSFGFPQWKNHVLQQGGQCAWGKPQWGKQREGHNKKNETCHICDG